MRFRYGKNDWKTFERGEENCYLMSNGLGGFSSLSLIGSCNRNDQAVLMACVHSPNNRYNMIHRLEEHMTVNGQCLLMIRKLTAANQQKSIPMEWLQFHLVRV